MSGTPAAAVTTAELHARFAQLDSLMADDAAALDARFEWLRGLWWWAAGGADERRHAALAAYLRADPGAAARLRATVQRVAGGADGLRLFTDAGFPGRASLPAEALVRLVRSVVPRPMDVGDMWDLVRRLQAGTHESDWMEGVTATEFEAFLGASELTECGGFDRLFADFAEAASVHCLRAAAIGLDSDVRRAMGRVAPGDSPFHRLGRAGGRLLDAVTAAPADPAAAAAARLDVEEAVAGARRDRDAAFAHLERAGVSTDMVLRLDVLGRCLDRIDSALPVLAPRPGESRTAAVTRVVAVIAAGVRQEGSFRRTVADRTRLLAKTVVERCGATGSHYITVGRRDWWAMARSGAGGGVVIGFVVWVKVSVHALHPPPGLLALCTFIDYAAGFLVIYALHLTLATKQPPMTAAALADALAKGGEGRDMAPVVTMVQRICRSQVAGLVGNVVATALTAFALDFAVRAVTGHPILTAEESAAALADHHPFRSLSILFAVVTGAAVWMSSMVSGWAENAAHYGRLTESLDAARGGRATAWLVRNVGGVAGNLSLALFLVMISFGGKVTGIPWDVRHVTVSTGNVTMALAATDAPTAGLIAWSVAGVLVVGFLNIATGFALSFRIATRARGVRARPMMRLVPALASAALRRPLQFVLPTDDAPAPAPSPH